MSFSLPPDAMSNETLDSIIPLLEPSVVYNVPPALQVLIDKVLAHTDANVFSSEVQEVFDEVCGSGKFTVPDMVILFRTLTINKWGVNLKVYPNMRGIIKEFGPVLLAAHNRKADLK
jgi:hypothetical protein